MLLSDVGLSRTSGLSREQRGLGRLKLAQRRIKIFGAMDKDSYLEISSHFGIYPLEQSIALRGDKFLKKYSSSNNYLCRLIAKH